MDDLTKGCPFCGSNETANVSDFGTSLMVALHRCARCNSYFEAIKWGDRAARLDVPPFLEERLITLHGGRSYMASTATQTEPNLVGYRTADGIAFIELTDPPANTYTYEMMRQLDGAILDARMDDDVHVIVIRGKGEKFFCAGANINMLNSVTPRFKYFFCLHANETLNRLEQTPKLVIAAMNGHCVGGGLEIAMAADIRLACKEAGKVGFPEVNLGVLPGTGGTQRLARIVGKSKAIELMITGRTFSFDEAKDMGIVAEVFPKETFEADVVAYAKQFIPPAKASKAVGLIKRSVQSGAEVPFESGLAIERELQQQLFQSEDAKEGLAAYVDKRKAQFKGR